MKPLHRNVLALTALASAVTLAGCAGKVAPPEPFDPAKAAEAQAASFIGQGKNADKYIKKVKKVAITSCNVMFAFKSNASAGTSAGMFSSAPSGTVRTDAQVTVEYNLHGMDDAAMKALTNQVCSGAEEKMRAAGFDVIPGKTVAANANFQGIHKNARQVPFEYKAAGQGEKTRYMVYAPDGQGIYDPRFIGVMAGLGAAFKAAKGENPMQYEGKLMDELGADAAHLNILVDFADMQSDGHKGSWGTDKNTANVKADARLAISGDMSFYLKEELNCWGKDAKRQCGIDLGKVATFNTSRPVISGAPFYTQIRNETTTGDKIAGAATKGLAMLAAMSGVKGGTSVDITRYGVDVDPAQYGGEVKKYAGGFVEMMLVSAKAAASK